MAIDRAATVKKAETLLGEGKLEAAIAEYVRLVEDQPSDWSAGNMLGDLYVRAGDRDRAVAQFRQIADSQYRQGFVGKATAFYKKALRVKGGDEHSLAQLAAIAAAQELVADAKGYLAQLLKQRRDRDDKAGVAECLVRIAALDEEDGDAKLAAARAGRGRFDSERTARLFVESAEAFERHAKHEEAKAVVLEAADIEIKDPELRRRMAELSGQTVTEAPAAAGLELPTSAQVDEVTPPTVSEAPVEAASIDRPPSIPPPPATLEVETSTGQTLSFERAEPAEAAAQADPPQPESSRAEPISHVDLMAMLDDSRESARAGHESSALPDDEPIVLNAADVSSDASMSFADAPDVSDFNATPHLSRDSRVRNVPTAPLVANTPNLPNLPNDPNDPNVPAVSAEVKARFEERLARSVRQTRPQVAESSPSATTERSGSEDGDADIVAQLEAAAKTPSLEFQASAQLGRLLIGRGDLRRGVEWLDRAARAPVQIPDHAMAVQYEIADVLERMGEPARALEVLRELEAHAGAYRDVRERIVRLTGDAGGDPRR